MAVGSVTKKMESIFDCYLNVKVCSLLGDPCLRDERAKIQCNNLVLNNGSCFSSVLVGRKSNLTVFL